MSTINKSATQIGTVEFTNGNRNTIYIGSNRNTGETILWQQVAGRKAQRVTGGNIPTLVGELDQALNTEGAKWIGDRNDVALDLLRQYR